MEVCYHHLLCSSVRLSGSYPLPTAFSLSLKSKGVRKPFKGPFQREFETQDIGFIPPSDSLSWLSMADYAMGITRYWETTWRGPFTHDGAATAKV